MRCGDLRNRLWVVLVEPEGRINFGFILRLARNFGIKGLCVVNPRFNVRDNEVLEFSSRGAEYLYSGRVRVVDNIGKCLDNVGLSICTTSKSTEEGDVLRHSITPPLLKFIIPCKGDVALVFGRESVGLTRSELRLCDLLVTIETGTDYNVLNLSHAVSIMLYEVFRDSSPIQGVLGEECSREVINAVLKAIEDISTYLSEVDAYIALKHILMRAALRKDECRSLYKLFKKLRHVVRSVNSDVKHNS